MSEHEKQKRIELADGVGHAIEAVIARAAGTGELIWTGQAVEQIQADVPDTELSPAEIAEAIVRAAADSGVPIAIHKVE